MEIKLLTDYPYEVHSDGTIYRIERKTRNGRRTLKRLQLRPHKGKNGYVTVKLYCPKEDCYKKIYVHHLIYQTFVGEIPPKYEIDHKNGLRSGKDDNGMDANDVRNLRAVTHKENCNNPRSLERYRTSNSLDKGKFDRDKMQAAKSPEAYNKLVNTYLELKREHGHVGIWMLMKVGHCGYPRARRIIVEMESKNDVSQ